MFPVRLNDFEFSSKSQFVFSNETEQAHVANHLWKFNARLLAIASAILFCAASFAHADDKPKVDYNRDIRPILAEACYKCHGPDGKQRQADLRLDVESVVGKRLESGHQAIEAGAAARSGVVVRILAKDPTVKMPPPESGKTLTVGQIELITRWIDQGAQWKGHWTYGENLRIEDVPVDRNTS